MIMIRKVIEIQKGKGYWVNLIGKGLRIVLEGWV